MSQSRRRARDERNEVKAHHKLEGVILKVETFVQLTPSGASNMIRRMTSQPDTRNNNTDVKQSIKFQGQAIARITIPTANGPVTKPKVFDFELPGVTSIEEAFERFEEFATKFLHNQKEKAKEIANTVQAATPEETAAVQKSNIIIPGR